MSLEWEYKKLGEICSFDKESITPLENIEYYHYSFPAFDNNKEPEVEMGQDIKSSKFLFNKGDILFNKLNVKFKRVWDIDFDIEENSICSTEFIPIQAKNIDRNFLYYCLISPNFTNEMKYLSTGTSNSHQRINIDDLKKSVQNAYYEQKDPLLIFKFESFELFMGMITKINCNIVEFLFKAKVLNDEEKEKYISDLSVGRINLQQEILEKQIQTQMKKKLKTLLN